MTAELKTASYHYLMIVSFKAGIGTQHKVDFIPVQNEQKTPLCNSFPRCVQCSNRKECSQILSLLLFKQKVDTFFPGVKKKIKIY